jgi:hypothetical protein
MSRRKISELPLMEDPMVAEDLMVIVDLDTNTTKKITRADFFTDIEISGGSIDAVTIDGGEF